MSSFYSLLNQFVNNANTVMLINIARSLGAVAFLLAASSYVLGLVRNEEINKSKAANLSTCFSIAAAVLCAFGFILFGVVGFVNKSRTMPGYVKPAEGATWIDNNGIYGTGYGGIGEATEVQSPVMVVDKDGKIHSIADEINTHWSGPDDNDTGALGGVAIAKNDDLGSGPQEMASLPSSLEH